MDRKGGEPLIRRALCVVRCAKRNTHDAIRNTQYGFTLIELIIAVSISAMISAALYFSLRSALESWQTSQDRLFLQHVCAGIMEELIEGLPEAHGLRETIEIVDASPQELTVVMPWTDDTHSVRSGIYTYVLNKHLKPGTSLPVAEALLPEAQEYKAVAVMFIDQGKSEGYPQLRLKTDVPEGSNLRFSFHPDYRKDADVLTALRYDASKGSIFIEDKDDSREISQNIFGIKLTDFLIRYFDNTNTELGMSGSISNDDIPAITGLEIAFKAKSKNGNMRETVSFVSLRNAPMHSGMLTLKEGARISIPNSKDVRAFFLTNLYGIDNNDMLILEAKPQSGSPWRLIVQFSKVSSASAALIESYAIEYPVGNKVYSESPRIPAGLGLNFLSLGTNGLYDYDDDQMQDKVLLTGKVILEAKRMDIGGASVFVKP